MQRPHFRNTARFLAVAVSAIWVSACATGKQGSRAASPLQAGRPAAGTSNSVPDISGDRYRSEVALLAHDELEGRGTGSDGIDLAAGYIAGQFAAAGLKPGGPNGTYFQEFEARRRPKLGDSTSLEFDGCPAEADAKVDFLPLGLSAQGEFAGDVDFVGYGVTNPEKQHDDYAALDVSGKVVLMLRREPPGWDPDGGFTDHARFDTKIKLAAEHGAAAVLIVNQDPGEDGIDGLMRFRPSGRDFGLPAIHLKRRVADELLAAGGLPSLTQLQSRIDKDGAAVSAPLAGVRAHGVVAFQIGEVPARNVIGILEGMGPQADEYVVIGAHYDHLGVRNGEIYNGADDNASGTAGVIELARAMAAAPYRDRSMAFMAFSAEEMGLQGSEHFVEEPTIEMDSIIAMINLDMIGHLNPNDEANKLAVHGLGTGDSFQDIVARHAEEVGLTYITEESALGPSDHASFYRAGVPALFFFTGVHPDYHQPGDDTDKLNVQGAVQILDLAHRVAMDLVNGEPAPVYAEVNRPAKIFRGASGVVLGIMPDMEDESDQPGWRVARVFPGSGADRGGVKTGDRILRIEDVTISGFSDYRNAIGDKKPGDMVEVTVLRGKEEVILTVQLTARGG